MRTIARTEDEMAAKKKTKDPPKKASGENIGEWQRRTERIVLRVQPSVAERIRLDAALRGQTISSYVSDLVIQEDEP
jgi:predicted HicB family RNase H-like nuclease